MAQRKLTFGASAPVERVNGESFPVIREMSRGYAPNGPLTAERNALLAR